jgi:hypothetical protein
MIERPAPPERRFWPKVDIEDPGDCWLWTGSCTRSGHGKISVGGRAGGLVPAHRWAYEYLVGPIPTGCELHHRCARPACVNPAHLEPVTRREHMIADGRMARRSPGGTFA